MDYAIEARGLRKRFGDTQALDGVDLAVRTGTVLGVLGPNGAGKTTAVRILATLLQADAGTAIVAGLRRRHASPPRSASRSASPASTRRVDELLTGRQNLELIGALLDLSRKDAQGARAGAARLVRPRRRRRPPRQDLLRRHAPPARPRRQPRRPPGVVFLDEPTTGLDPAKREDMWGVVRNLVADGSTVLLTTQYLEEADALADEITVIDHGRVIAHDTPDGLKQHRRRPDADGAPGRRRPASTRSRRSSRDIAQARGRPPRPRHGRASR